jgi:hypothetical protein
MEGTSYYRVTVRGTLSEHLASAFEGMRIEAGDGSTVLVGAVRDQAELYGLVDLLRDFGLELLELEKVNA